MLALLDLTRHLATHGFTITIVVTPKNLPILTPLLSSSPNIQPLVLPFPPHPSLPNGENIRDIGNKANALLDYACRNISLVRSQDTTVFHDLPNSPSLSSDHLPTLVRSYRESDPEWELVFDLLIANASSWGWVVNTFDALEGQYIEHLKKLTGHERVFGVGLISLLEPVTRGLSEPGSGFDVLTWLDGRPDGSVVYVCFGSQKFLTSDQMEGLAIGLEDSGVHYVWVVKPEQGDLVRAGSGRGVVIKGWAPQVAILSHRAVGGFVSHCGWNSVLESILAGVMILAWPMEADQYVNARLLVEEHGVAVRICEGPDTVPDPARLARMIAESMGGDKSEKLKAKELKNKATEAVKDGGSSSMEMDRFVKELSKFQPKMNEK
ncbi:hypothetical protein L1987_61451 [Smallanthus sonchifolius]|uniref:Uncharacterized protein n=1 Tax=Smallanthus sonchifolius TaxID=185202 RepID=A0ACB9C7N5_9ASTR|nr:hypothetical protein L1987_61451 [Smallanthus sonchifolius]